MKISVITPTYNDAQSIEETLCSLKCQTYPSWQWIIVDDGSTDKTKEVVEGLIQKYQIEKQTIFLHQENSDQQNAIIHALKYVEGEYVFLLHSDDLLPSTDFFEKCIGYMQAHQEVDGLLGDLILIDDKSNSYGKQNVPVYRQDPRNIALTLLWLGRNLYADFAFHKASIFKKEIKENYLLWNMPFWITYHSKQPEMLNYAKVDFPILKYRVHQGNYIHHDIGKLNVLSGELRTAIKLLGYYDIPHFKPQYYLYRFYHRFFQNRTYPLKYRQTKSKQVLPIIEFIITKRYPKKEDYPLFLEAILGFYGFQGHRILRLTTMPKNMKLYYGKDGRCFFKKMQEGTLEEFYMMFMIEMKAGFSEILLYDKNDLERLKVILKFMCIEQVKVKCLDIKEDNHAKNHDCIRD